MLGWRNDFSQVLTLDIFPLEQINVPTLIIHAKDDTLVSIKHARFSAKFIPDARLVELPSGGHLFIGQRDHLQAEVELILAEVNRGK